MELEVRRLRDDERAAAGAVAGRALSTNPTSYFAYGDNALARVGGSLELFVGFVQGQQEPFGAVLGGHVVGLCGASPPGQCLGATAPPELREPPAELGEPGDFSRAQHVWSLFCGHDLDERHWHVGPVGVEPVLQGAGVGSAVMKAFTEFVDAEGEVAWLETDKPENVVFYRRHGFEVAEEDRTHGLTTWWMRRDPH